VVPEASALVAGTLGCAHRRQVRDLPAVPTLSRRGQAMILRPWHVWAVSVPATVAWCHYVSTAWLGLDWNWPG
jgi:hypothetical protein